MQEIDRRMAMLRLMLADITARAAQSQENERRLRAQHQRIIDFAVQRNAGVGNALALLAETEAQQAQEAMTLRHLEELRRRVQSELDALLLTRSVSDAQQRLAELEARRRELLSAGAGPGEAATEPPGIPQSKEVAEIDAEMVELRKLIADASESAARALAPRQPERSQRET
jgi:hypothetical protein